MRVAALATVGLWRCAASIKDTSKGSPCCCHHCDKPPTLPWCGKGANHCGAMLAGGGGDGRRLEQADKASTIASASELVVLLTVFNDWYIDKGAMTRFFAKEFASI